MYCNNQCNNYCNSNYYYNNNYFNNHHDNYYNSNLFLHVLLKIVWCFPSAPQTWNVDSVRVRRAAGAIAFTGVSIISSALTTILAILPLLATEIQLFARFGEILILDTLVTLLYSVVFCATFLSLWGPVHSRCTRCSWLNAILTISVTLGFYVLVVVVLRIVSLYGVEIPSPVGGALF